MSLAWGSLVVLLLLLPGVLFFVGLYMPENFTRESTERSAIGQMSAVLGVSVSVHAALMLLNWMLSSRCPSGAPLYYAINVSPLGSCAVPSVDIEQVIRVVVLEASEKDGSISTVAEMLRKYLRWILVYLFSSYTCGVALGYSFGRWLVPLVPGFAPHPWVLELSQGEDLTVAYVLTHIKHENRILAYHGFLKTFALKRDGTFAYVVLKEAVRGYMLLGESAPEVQPLKDWRVIGAAAKEVIQQPSTQGGRRLIRRYLSIEGEDIANLVFERYEAAALDVSQEQLEETIDNVLKNLPEAVKSLLRAADEQEKDVPASIWQLYEDHQLQLDFRKLETKREDQ